MINTNEEVFFTKAVKSNEEIRVQLCAVYSERTQRNTAAKKWIGQFCDSFRPVHTCEQKCARMCGWNCEHVLRHLRTVRIPFAVN